MENTVNVADELREVWFRGVRYKLKPDEWRELGRRRLGPGGVYSLLENLLKKFGYID